MEQRKSDEIMDSQGRDETRLGLPLDILPKSKTGWTIENAQHLVELIRQKKTPEEISKAVKKSVFGVQGMTKELRKAAEKGYTLEQYFRMGRPFAAFKKKVGE